MHSAHDFRQTVIDENYNKTLHSNLSEEDINNLRSYFEAALAEMAGKNSNSNINLSRDALENLAKTLRHNSVNRAVDQITKNIDTHTEKNNIGTISKIWLYCTKEQIPSGVIGSLIATAILAIGAFIYQNLSSY